MQRLMLLMVLLLFPLTAIAGEKISGTNFFVVDGQEWETGDGSGLASTGADLGEVRTFSQEHEMSDKPVAAFVAALAIAPICAICILGPAFIGSVLASIFGWFAGPRVIGLAIIMVALGAGLYLLVKRKQRPNGRDKAWR